MNPTATELEKRLLRLTETGPEEERNARAEELLQEMRGTAGLPFIIEDRAYFLYHGDADEVELAGDWTFWQVASPFTRVEGTDLFYTVLEFPDTARLQYKLVVDGRWTLDPNNGRYAEEGFGVNSEFWMSGYRDASYLTPKPAAASRGTVREYRIESELLGETRGLFLYTPSGGAPAGGFPLLIVHDGEEAIRIGRFPTILDNLTAMASIEPCCALFLPPRFRNSEYASNRLYTRYCIEEAIPFAIETWEADGITISPAPQDRCVLGASLGGLLATEMSLSAPEVVGAVIAQSPAYWVNKGAIFQGKSLKRAGDVRVVLQTGTICDARELTRIMYGRLRERGAAVRYFEYQQGHTWGNWRSNLAEAVFAWNDLRASAS